MVAAFSANEPVLGLARWNRYWAYLTGVVDTVKPEAKPTRAGENTNLSFACPG
jgi:hypothetical protein